MGGTDTAYIECDMVSSPELLGEFVEFIGANDVHAASLM
jgi:hypothetical protein